MSLRDWIAVSLICSSVVVVSARRHTLHVAVSGIGCANYLDNYNAYSANGVDVYSTLIAFVSRMTIVQ